MNIKSLLVLLICFGAVGALQAQVESPWQLRFRAISISPDESTSTILDTGTEVAVDSAVTLELDLSYYFQERWSLEVIAATAEHELSTVGGALAGADAGDVWVLPPTVTLQYHFADRDAPFDVYLGLGINYTLFYSYSVSADLEGLGVGDIDFDSSFGLAGQIGANFRINDKWHANVDIKWIDINFDATLELAAGGDLAVVDVDLDPYVYGAGVGFRF